MDASELSISDMGTMNNAMGGGMGGPMEREDISAQPQGEEVPSGGQPFDLPVGEDSASCRWTAMFLSVPRPTPQQKADKIL